MFAIIVRYQQPLDVVDAFVTEHRAFLDRHYAAGHFLLSGPQSPRVGGVILAKNLSRDALEQVIAEDPFHREGIAEYEIIEFHPNKFGPGVEACLSAP